MRFKHLCLLALLLSVCAGRTFAQTERQYEVACVAFYNIENLFDTIHQEGVNDYDFLPDGKYKWNSEKYWSKISNIAKVINQIGTASTPTGPVVLGIAEVENRSPLEDLVKDPQIKERNYQIVHHDGPDRRGIDVALLYNPDFFVLDTFFSYTLRIPDRPDFRTRDQLLVKGDLMGEEFHFIVVHWPSRTGGESRSRPLRVAAAELAKHLFDSVMTAKPDAKIILMGDMNDDPTDKSIATVLKATSNKSKINSGGHLFNPSETLHKNGIGTLAYRDVWNMFDQMILTPSIYTENRQTLSFYQFKVFNEKWLRQPEGQYKDYPLRTFGGGAWLNGYSDHFPVYVLLIRELNAE
ncbi:MAG: endonuclease/exonuclease/phosphatase family protein [Bacteroidales bacterium]|nr:endonuclease/exonuclease/phosphatase family protein [Bacteroidales bacterium]